MNRALFLYATAFAILAGVPFAGATSFSYISLAGAQEYSVTTTGEYYLSATGGQGGGADFESPFGVGGDGASVNGYFNLTAGEQIDVVVGGQGWTGPFAGDGGGGTFIFICAAADCESNQADDTLLLAAGGGGGAGIFATGAPPPLGVWLTYPGDYGGAAGEGGSGNGGGADGYGGSAGASGGGAGGGGWNNFAFGLGGAGDFSISYVSVDGVEVPLEIFGGGGGGGGYSGGGGGDTEHSDNEGGGGGGDYDAGLNPGYDALGTGDGSAEIDLFMAAPPPTPIPEPSSPGLLALGTLVLLAVRRRAARLPLPAHRSATARCQPPEGATAALSH